MKKSLLNLKSFLLVIALFFIGNTAFADDLYTAAAEEVLVASASLSDSVLTPSMDFSTYVTKTLVFSYGGSGSGGGTLTITYSTDGGLTWNPLTVKNPTSTSYVNNFSVDMSAITETDVIVKFKATVKSIKIKLVTISASLTDINENVLDNNISITGNTLQLNGLSDAAVSIYNTSSALILSEQVTGSTSVVLSKGMYLVKISSEEISGIKKLIIK